MIPKKIHFCWLSGEDLPSGAQHCLRSWQRWLPDYEIIRWDIAGAGKWTSPFLQEALSRRKWAFASDYIRLIALYEEGGIYLDSDVLVRKNLDTFLANRFFSGVERHPSVSGATNHKVLQCSDGRKVDFEGSESGIGIQAAILGAEAGHPFLKDCLDFYAGVPFSNYHTSNTSVAIAPDILAHVAARYGFTFVDRQQQLKEGMTIFASQVFAPQPPVANRASVAIHYCAGTWREAGDSSHSIAWMRKLKNNSIIRRLMGKPPRLSFR